MQRVMIVGQPGAGKSTLARDLGKITALPVIHIDLIHWKRGWVERTGPEKDALIADIHAQPKWIFEGGRSSTWAERLARADTLIWLDFPLALRFYRVIRRTLRHYGRTRPDLPAGCPEQFSAEFYGYIWQTRYTARAKMAALYDSAPPDKRKHQLSSPNEVCAFLDDLRAETVG